MNRDRLFSRIVTIKNNRYMKAFRIVQRTAAAAGLLIALKMVDNLQPSDNELLGGMMLALVCIMVLIGQALDKAERAEQEERQQREA